MGLRPASATSNGSPVPASTAPTLGNGNANGNGNGNGAGNGATADGDLASKQIFTTGEAAEICKISQQTIIRCFDSGRVHGFRVPGSKFRRIPREELIRFMRENGIPTDALEGARKRILVVDDDADASEIARRLLELGGWTVETAANGQEALDRLSRNIPTLVIIDLVMPVMDGFSLVERLKSQPPYRNIPIVVLSALSLAPEEHRRLNNRIAAPPSQDDPLEDLMTTVHRFLG